MMFDPAQLAGNHDLCLPAWGPYTKHYMGISHIPSVKEGLRFDLSVFPGLYRRSVAIPNVMWECGYHPWQAAPDLSFFEHRHELLWKDLLSCDISFSRLDDDASLIACRFANQTEEPQNVVLHYMASLHFPPLRIYSQEPIRPVAVHLPEGGVWLDGLDYARVSFNVDDPRANLTEDGHKRGELRDHGFVGGQGLGRGFGRHKGDRVVYGVPTVVYAVPTRGAPTLIMRYRMWQGDTAQVTFSGAVQQKLALRGRGEFALLRLPLDGGESTFTITSDGDGEIQIDGFAIVPAGTEDQVRFTPVIWNPMPQRLAGPRPDTLILKYDQAAPFYGLAWGHQPFELREFIGDDLDTLMRHTVHEHVRTTLRGKGEGHFTNVFMRPIFLPPHGAETIYGLVCSGDQQSVWRCLSEFDPRSPHLEERVAQARHRAADLTAKPSGEPYRFSQERMAATVLTNVVYPVRTRGTWIRHNTPGRWWDCLYTWDSGFIGLGLLELDVQRALDCLNAYVTEPDEEDAAFIHHGSPVPVQFPLFLELWNRTRSQELLAYFYPRLQRYHRFLAGRLGSSTTRTQQSNLLRTWDYFYNSGGWDDYPPQKHVHALGLERTVTPIINTAQAILTAQILRAAASVLGEPTAEYDADIAVFTRALRTYAWDEASGYFGYVEHDEKGQPLGILRHESGVNFNMGLDGIYPLIAAVCTAEQEQRLVSHLMSSQRLWCACGLSTVDQSAPYFRHDGYWNGAVWMPHQWYIWKALLDLGYADEAHRIASTALGVWQREVERSYNCFEHFIVQTGRGAGWHHFGGLSSPVLCWYGAYHRSGRLTTGLHAWVETLDIPPDAHSLSAGLRLFAQPRHRPIVIASLAPDGDYTARWNDQVVPVHQRYAGTMEVRLPCGEDTGTLDIRPQ